MALQENNLMLLDANGFPRTIDGTNDQIGIGVDLIVGGDLTVNGDIVSGGTQDVVVTDNFIDLNNGNVLTAMSGGLTVQVQGNSNQTLAGGVTFRSKATTGANADLSITGVDPSGLGGLAINKLIELSGMSAAGENNGLFVVAAINAGVGGTIEVKPAQANTVPFAQTNFDDETESAGTLAWNLDVGVITISGGALPSDAVGGTITKGSFATAFASNASDDVAGGAAAFIYGDAASVSLQEAYNEGQTITLLDTEGDLIITTDETGAVADFKVIKGGGAFPYLQTDATNDLLVLGAMNGNSPETKVALNGQLATNITFDASGPFTIANVNQAGTQSQIELAGKSASLFAVGTAAGDEATVSARGLNAAAGLVAQNAYAGGASVAGDISGTITDVNGAESVLTITFGAAAADLAALIAGATVSPVGAVNLSNDGAGALLFESAALGARVFFSFNAESAGGVGNSIGFAGFPGAAVFSSDGMAALRTAAQDATGDTTIQSGRHIDMLSFGGGIRIKSQTAGRSLELDAQSGTLDLHGDDVQLKSDNAAVVIAAAQNLTLDTNSAGHDIIIGGASPAGADVTVQAPEGDLSLRSTGAGAHVVAITSDGTGTGATAAINIGTSAGDIKASANQGLLLDGGASLAIGGVSPSASTFGTTSLAITSSATSSWALTGAASKLSLSNTQQTGADAITIAATVGGVIVNAATGIDLNAGAAINSILIKGFAEQVVADSAGMGAVYKYDTAAGGNSGVGDLLSMVNNGGAMEVKQVGAALAEAPGVCGVFLEAVAGGADVKCHTMHGARVAVAYDGGGAPAAADIGAPVYLSATAGKAAKVAPTAAGQHVIRLGFAAEAGQGIIWAPQYIAKRPA